MKVCISVPGRFHAFDLALQLQKAGHLYCLITSYPRFKVKEFGLEEIRVKTVFSKELVMRGYYKLFKRYPNWFWLNEWYDKIASLKMPMDADIYILWAGFALRSINRIRKRNPKAIIILERGSAHIETQKALLSLVGQQGTILDSIIRKEKAEYFATDFISVPGKFVANTFLAKGFSAQKLFINHYGVDLTIFKSGKEKQENKIFTIGYVGSISKRKNIEGLIQIVIKLIEKGNKLKLLMAGGLDAGSYTQDYLKQFDFISYLGNIPQNRLPDVYNAMDVFVLNSVEDGFGMVLLQAMSMGVPAIATHNSGGIDVIKNGENGLLIPILDDAALINSIEFLIKNPKSRMHMGELAEISVHDCFGWNDYGRRYIKFLLESTLSSSTVQSNFI